MASKPFVNCFYRSEESRREDLDRKKASEDSRDDMKEKQRQAAADGLAKMVERVKVGTIFHYSWGYDQTNCEFWEVVAIGTMVDVREIGAELRQTGYMAGQCKPRPGNFLVESCRRCHQVMKRNGDEWVGEDGSPNCESNPVEHGHVVSQRFPTLRKRLNPYGISFPHGSGSITTADEEHYSSSYA